MEKHDQPETTWRRVPLTPSLGHLNSMALRYRHDFGLLNESQQSSIRSIMRQLYEEAVGQGFFTLPIPPSVAVNESRERLKFERQVVLNNLAEYEGYVYRLLERNAKGNYANTRINGAWWGWLERAAEFVAESALPNDAAHKAKLGHQVT